MAKEKKIQKKMVKAEAFKGILFNLEGLSLEALQKREFERLEASQGLSRGFRGLPLISQLDSPKGKGKGKGKKGLGIIESIANILLAKGNWINREGILSELIRLFPERDQAKMAKTVQAQLGGKAPCRLEKEKGIKIEIKGKGKGQAYFRPDSLKA